MYYDDINVTKEKLLRMGKNMISSSKPTASRKEFSKVNSVRRDGNSSNKEFKLLDDESGEMLDVKLDVQKINDAMESPNPRKVRSI